MAGQTPLRKFFPLQMGGVLDESVTPARVGGSGMTYNQNLIYRRLGAWGKRSGSNIVYLPMVEEEDVQLTGAVTITTSNDSPITIAGALLSAGQATIEALGTSPIMVPSGCTLQLGSASTDINSIKLSTTPFTMSNGALFAVTGASAIVLDTCSVTFNGGQVAPANASLSLSEAKVVVNGAIVLAAFHYVATALVVVFTDKSIGLPMSYAWDFGDSGTSTSASPTHTYASAGTYTVKQTVMDTFGNSSTCTIEVTVS